MVIFYIIAALIGFLILWVMLIFFSLWVIKWVAPDIERTQNERYNAWVKNMYDRSREQKCLN